MRGRIVGLCLLLLMMPLLSGCIITWPVSTPRIEIRPGDGAEFSVESEEVLVLPLKVSSNAKFVSVNVRQAGKEPFWAGSPQDIPSGGLAITGPQVFQDLQKKGYADIEVQVEAEQPETVDDGTFFKIIHPAVMSHESATIRFVSTAPKITGVEFPLREEPCFVLHVDKGVSQTAGAACKVYSAEGKELASAKEWCSEAAVGIDLCLELEPLDAGEIVGVVVDGAGHVVPFNFSAEVQEDTSGAMKLVPIPPIQQTQKWVTPPKYKVGRVTVRAAVSAQDFDVQLEGGDYLNILFALISVLNPMGGPGPP